MKLSAAFEVDTDHLPIFSDEYLSQLWHIAQANPAPAGDAKACDFAEAVGREIIKRWLASTPAALWNHQGRHVNQMCHLGERAI